MRAELKPLEGKYYGSQIEIFDDDDLSAGAIVAWFNPNRPEDWKPSERELKAWDDMLRRENSDEEYEALTNEEKEYEICDNHYETALALKVCKALIEKINEPKEKGE